MKNKRLCFFDKGCRDRTPTGNPSEEAQDPHIHFLSSHNPRLLMEKEMHRCLVVDVVDCLGVNIHFY